MFKISPNTKLTHKEWPNNSKVLQKWRNFAKSGRTAPNEREEMI